MLKEYITRTGYITRISVQQPHGWLIIHGHKNLENRDWTTSYRGPLLIHAGKRVDEQCFDSDGRLLIEYWRSRYGDELVARMPQHQREYETGGIDRSRKERNMTWQHGLKGMCRPMVSPFIITALATRTSRPSSCCMASRIVA